MAKLSIKLLPLIGVFLLLSVVGYFLIKTEREDIGEIILDEIVPIEGISAKNVKVALPVPDKDTTWRLEADKVFTNEKEKEDEIVRFEGFRIKFEPEKSFTFELEGKSGEINRANNEIDLSGEVKGKTSNGYKLFAKNIVVQVKKNCLKSDDAVTFVGPFFKITGKGLFIDLEKKKLKILKNVNSTFDKESLII